MYIISDMSEALRSSSQSPTEVVCVGSEITPTPEVLGPKCLVRFSMDETLVDEGGAHAQGFISCEAADCTLRDVRLITGDVDLGAVVNSEAAAEAKVFSRARRQMAYECAVWTSDPANVGVDIPNEKLPQILQRH